MSDQLHLPGFLTPAPPAASAAPTQPCVLTPAPEPPPVPAPVELLRQLDLELAKAGPSRALLVEPQPGRAVPVLRWVELEADDASAGGP
jgi:hypothetical protein